VAGAASPTNRMAIAAETTTKVAPYSDPGNSAGPRSVFICPKMLADRKTREHAGDPSGQ
jgi:hypothetical protein